MRNKASRSKGNLRFFRDTPKTLNSRQARFPKGNARFELGGLPEPPLGSPPGGIRSCDGWQLVFSAHSFLQIGGAQIFDEHAKTPAIGNRVVNRADQHLIIGSTPKNVDPIERAVEQIEGLGKSLECQLFEFVVRCLWR